MKRFLLLGILLCLVAMPLMASPKAGDAGYGVGMSLGVGFIAFGLVVNNANIAAMYKSFLTIFNEAMSAATPQYTKIAMVVPSSTRSNNYAWMAALPKMREWIGDRQVGNLAAFVYEILNKTWEVTLGIPREDVEDDQYGMFGTVVKVQTNIAVLHPDELVFGLLNKAFTTGKSYDGKTYFATDHESGSNKATYALTPENYAKAMAALGRVKDANGNPMFTGSEKVTLVTGPELEDGARKILNSDLISVAGGSSQTNVWKNSADYMKSPQITSATAWFLLVDFYGLRGLVFQKRRDLKFTAVTDPESPVVFKTNKFEYGMDARYNAGYGLHQLAFGSTGAGA